MSDEPQIFGEFKSKKTGKMLEWCDEEAALSILLREGVLFSNTGEFDGDKTVCLFVNCNDLFAWACADAEHFKHHEIPELYRAWESGSWGVERWCCIRRNQKPQKPAEKIMREKGMWDDVMDALPDNTQDVEVQGQFARLRKYLKGKALAEKDE